MPIYVKQPPGAGQRQIGRLGLGPRFGQVDLEGDGALGLEAGAAPFQFSQFVGAFAGTGASASGREHAGRRGDGLHRYRIERPFRQSGLERRPSAVVLL